MMLRATVVDLNPRDPTRVWVTIPQKYGTKPLRVFTRVQVTKGDHVYVANTSVTRIPQWVVFDQQTEVGAWGNPYPHTHPMGQVDGLVNWVKEYEAWAKDHQARLDAAEKQIADGKLVVDQTRKDLDKAQTDIAAAVREATLERARLDQAEANLDQMGRDLLAAGGRISANETALAASQKRLDAAETTVQKTTKDLTTLQGTVGDVSAKVIASDQKAADALAKAGAAQVSADGKTTITRALEPRTTQPGTAVGDTHFTMSSMGDGGVVTRQQRWDGSTWQDEALSHQVLASLDLGKATVGELDGGRIRANSVTADRVLIGVGQNLVANPSAMTGAPAPHTAFSGGVKTGVAGSTSGNVFYTSLTQGTWGDAFILKSGVTAANGRVGDFVLDPRAEYVFRLRVKKASGAGTARVKITVFNVSGGFVKNVFTPDTPVTTTWSNLEVRLSAADVSGGVSAAIIVQNPRDGEYWYEALDFRELGTGALFVDGSITGKQIEAYSVAGEIGQFLKVEAQSGTFTDSLTGRNARLLGETVAESINITGKIRGRDAILSGTVDVGQLNVTGAMSAKIISTATLQARQGFFTDGLTAQDATLLGTTVAENLVVTDAFSARVVNAMTAQTKQLVVTEDAILNRATVVQSLVTSELITQKADINTLAANMVSAGAIVSRNSTGSVQITPAGITAQDATPSGTFTRQVKLTPSGLTGGTRTTQTVRIDGANNYMTGTFATAADKQRVEIKSSGNTASADFYGSNDTVDHLGVWHNADVGVDTVSKIISFNQIAQHSNSPGVLMYPFRGEVALAGRLARESDTIKMVVSQNTNGLAAGLWADFTYTYATPFTATNSLRFPFLSVESATGRECVAMIMEQTLSYMKVRVVNKSEGHTGALIVRGIVFHANTPIYTKYW